MLEISINGQGMGSEVHVRSGGPLMIKAKASINPDIDALASLELIEQGEAVKAWVVLRAGQSASESDLRTFCREKLAAYKVPTRIEFRQDLPKTMVGKVLRRALREGG